MVILAPTMPSLQGGDLAAVLRGCCLTTIDQALIRGLSTARRFSVADLPPSTGENAVLIVKPYYNKPSQAGLIAHFGTAAEATSLPVMLYSVPDRCGVEITPETCVVLRDADDQNA